MQRIVTTVALIAGLTLAPWGGPDRVHAGGERRYQVNVTNVTNAQTFTPVLAATHQSDVTMFLPGTAASPELQMLAEGGAVGPLMGLLASTPGVGDLHATEGLLTRGVTTQFQIDAGPGDHLSLAAMLIPTNDAFMGLNTPLPSGVGDTMVVYAFAYDAGSERNDELCASIPGPNFTECGGPGGGATVGGGEGAVTIHRGIQGVGDFDADRRDWRNPVARIWIRRLQ